MTSKRETRPFTLWLLIALTFAMGIAAGISGPLLFLAPDGHLMQWTTDMLKGTPFTDFFVPGLILFILVGLFSIFTAVALLRQPEWPAPNALNPWKKLHWAWAASLAAGVIILGWVIIETLLVGYISFLQPVIAIWGALILLLTLLPSVRARYAQATPAVSRHS